MIISLQFRFSTDNKQPEETRTKQREYVFANLGRQLPQSRARKIGSSWRYIKYCVFSEDFEIFRTHAFLCFPSVCQCVYTQQTGSKPALQQNWQSSEKSQNLKEKTQYLMNTLQYRRMDWFRKKGFLKDIDIYSRLLSRPQVCVLTGPYVAFPSAPLFARRTTRWHTGHPQIWQSSETKTIFNQHPEDGFIIISLSKVQSH